jgi:cobalt-zinc-cadmium efflux system membrane fusion protein
MNLNRYFGLAVMTALLVALTACSSKTAETESAASEKTTEQHAGEAKDGHGKEESSGEHAEEAGGEHAEEEGGEHGEEAAAKSISMDAKEMSAAGIRVAKLDKSLLNEELRTPGEVVDNAYGTTLITPRVDSIVVRRHAKLGSDVKAGAPLVTLSSVEVAQTQGALLIAEQEWKRMQSLGRDAVSGRRYSEAQIAVELARAAARAYGLPGSAVGQANGEFTLTAPHAGRITEDNFVVGERIEPGRTLFRVVDESIVWIDAKLPAESAQRVAVGSAAYIIHGDIRLNGKVVQRSHRTAEGTRNSLVRIEVVNKNDSLHGGDYVDAYLDAGGNGESQLTVPTAAVLQLEGDTVVFRQSADNTLEPVSIRTGNVIGNRTVITDGLKLGDVIVIEGAYALKAQILKSKMGEGHGH